MNEIKIPLGFSATVLLFGMQNGVLEFTPFQKICNDFSIFAGSNNWLPRYYIQKLLSESSLGDTQEFTGYPQPWLKKLHLFAIESSILDTKEVMIKDLQWIDMEEISYKLVRFFNKQGVLTREVLLSWDSGIAKAQKIEVDSVTILLDNLFKKVEKHNSSPIFGQKKSISSSQRIKGISEPVQ